MQAIPPSIEPEGIFDGLRWSAILLGAVLDNVLTNLAILPLLVLFGPAEVFSNDSQAVERAIEENWTPDRAGSS